MQRVLPLLVLLAGCAAAEWTRDYDGDVPMANPRSVYAVMVVVLLWRPHGLFVRRGAR